MFADVSLGNHPGNRQPIRRQFYPNGPTIKLTHRRIGLIVSMSALLFATGAPAQDYHPTFHPDDLKGPPAGARNEVVVLGTPHLSGLDDVDVRTLRQGNEGRADAADAVAEILAAVAGHQHHPAARPDFRVLAVEAGA